MQIVTGYQCGSCGEWVDTVVDASGGDRQTYVEDCAVCCRPNLLRIFVDRASGTAEVLAEFDG